MLVWLILGAFCLLLYFAITTMTKPKNFPPGPVGLPFIGSFHLIGPNFNKKIEKMAAIYGNIFSVKLKNMNFVCICGYDLFAEVMNENPKPYSGRPKLLMYELTRGPNLEGVVVGQHGPRLVAQRKLFHSVFRHLGIGNKNFDKIIVQELPEFVESIENMSEANQTVDLTSTFDCAVLNVLAYYTFGNRYSYGDEKFKWLIHCNNEFFKEVEQVFGVAFTIVSFIPYLHKIWLPKAGKAIQYCCRELEAFIGSEIEYHKKTRDQNHPRDFIDFYLEEMSSQSSKLFSESDLRKTVLDFFQAGTETTTTTLKWAVLYVVNNPDIQEKIHAEIDEVLGFDKWPCYEDRLKMPFTEATIMEVQRKANIAPIGVLHSTNKAVKLGGYNLPKGTCIVPCYHSIHYSPKHWKNPNQFDPTNFLDADGKVGTRPAFMPFGGGLRICLGMNIAKQELFLFFVTMLQHFKLQPPPGVLKLDEKYVSGGTLQPKSYQIVVKSRR
uniref:Cytochrome P450 2C42-like n=1 Tax=Phallusia mammillata TaxID=59560 RepID=A0A6F9D9N8_9ASCI|nr:cytochrome P450 2C42-like [Phallusia mammillata]